MKKSFLILILSLFCLNVYAKINMNSKEFKQFEKEHQKLYEQVAYYNNNCITKHYNISVMCTNTMLADENKTIEDIFLYCFYKGADIKTIDLYKSLCQ